MIRINFVLTAIGSESQNYAELVKMVFWPTRPVQGEIVTTPTGGSFIVKQVIHDLPNQQILVFSDQHAVPGDDDAFDQYIKTLTEDGWVKK